MMIPTSGFSFDISELWFEGFERFKGFERFRSTMAR